ncbi:hypothetical protein RJ639_016372 [Escallonia herrerae]|uniref:Phytocyanin domain-containing protein n=1 Tax=Escallonia herrerae TaxID=1293975 RepID=A0AA88VBA7_9ASTE|nr:hypothetical protein RJ639_016372 [Escallonia herrerae]
MVRLRIPRYQLWSCTLKLFLLIQTQQVFCNQQYKVGDLDSWGIPTSANPRIYTAWSKNHIFEIGDSLCNDFSSVFLYPPSQDSVVQVTQQSFNGCNLTDPILYMNNGNSLFNITSEGEFYFTSGVEGHCQKSQKLYISVGNVSSSTSPSDGPSASSPSYPTVFGSIPAPPSSSPLLEVPVLMSAAIVFSICALVGGTM